MAVLYQHPRRTFNPEVTARYGRPTLPINKLVKYSPKYGWARMFNFPYRGSHWRPRMFTVVISIDGPCRTNNRADPRSQSAWGVYWSPGNAKNKCGVLPASAPQTNSRAELEALRQAIIQVHELKIMGYFNNNINPFKEVIVRLTSQYVLDAFHKHIWNWEINGWRKVSGHSVEHAHIIAEFHHLICNMEHNMQMAVRFWRTERDEKAAALARGAFAEDYDSSESDN